ncbi:hypothetical protein Tsubulata_048422, partial [Turnera subulata]
MYAVSVAIMFEPRISGAPAGRVVRRLGLPNSHRVDAWRFSGGIWLLWKNNVTVQLQIVHFQVILELFSLRRSMAVHSRLCGNFYRRTFVALRLRCPIHGVAGDFNAILSASEIRGTTTSLRRGCRRFQQCVDSCGLEDLGYHGPHFTWRRGLVWEHLDRALGNIYGFSLSRLHSVVKRKRSLLKRLASIQRYLSLRPSLFLSALEVELRREYSAFLGQEELLWFQKSRYQWINDGDRNTAFHHARTVVRQRHNFVATLQDEEGRWCTDQRELQSLSVRFYR